MDWSEKNLCIRCDKGDNVLVCSENGCPISIHEECMGCPARFDDAGNFCCPYCLYKEAISETSRARKDAMEKKKALLIFIGDEPQNGEKLVEEHEKSIGKMHEESKDAVVDDTVLDKDSISDKDVYEERVPEDDEDPEEEANQGDDDSMASSVEEDEGSGASSEPRNEDPSFQLHEEPKEDDEMVEAEDSQASSESIREADSPVRVGLRSNGGGNKRSHTDEADGDDTLPLQSKRAKTSTSYKDNKQTCEDNFGTPRKSARRTGDKDRKTCEETFGTPRRSSRRNGEKDKQTCEETVDTPRKSARRTGDKDKQTCEETLGTPRSSSRRAGDKDKQTCEETVGTPRRSSRRTGDKDEQTCEETVHTPRRSSRRTGGKDKQTCEETVHTPRRSPRRTEEKDKQTCEGETPRRSSRRRSISSPGNDEDADRISEMPQQQPSVKPARQTFRNAKKRTPLLWSQKEEEILEEGVKIFLEPDRKLRWRKILEYGRKVFHCSRTPTDLKDKWRKMVTTK